MSKNLFRADNRGGHNKQISENSNVSLEPVRVEEYPWLSNPNPQEWNRKKIFEYLSEKFYNQKMTLNENSRDIVTSLAIDHYVSQLCLQELDTPSTPNLEESQKAIKTLYAAQRNIQSSMKVLGVYPFQKLSLEKYINE